VRLLALAERLRMQRELRPTMSAERARQMAENADGAAYADAVSEYAAQGRDELHGGGPRSHGGYFGSRLNLEVDQK
jgi:hypothetical protein